MGDDCCRTCERWGKREAELIDREPLEASGGLKLVVRGTEKAVEISAARPVVNVGRAAGNDIVLPSGNVSKRQMRFVFVDGAVYAEDLKSACGTYVDGRKIGSRTRLGRDSVVSFADYDVELVERTASPT
jgi:pSer/pThr/pTyr-binding forkhead associated (FHA) protein